MLKIRICYAFLLCAAVFLCLFFSDTISVCALILLLSLPCLLFLQALFCLLSVKISLPKKTDITEINENCEQILNVKNTSFFPVFRVKIILSIYNNFDVKYAKYAPNIQMRKPKKNKQIQTENIIISLTSKETRDVLLNFKSEHCGKHILSVSKVICYDPLALTACFMRFKKKKTDEEIYVLPMEDGTEFELGEIKNRDDIESANFSKNKSGTDYSECFDYHEYQDGDKLKYIHRALSNRLNKLMVKEGSMPISSKVCLLFEADTFDMNALDLAFSRLLLASKKLLENEIIHDIGFFCGEDECIRFVSIENNDDFIFALTAIFETNLSEKKRTYEFFIDGGYEQKYSDVIYFSAKNKTDSFLNEEVIYDDKRP